MYLQSNQPAKIYGRENVDKFNNISEINISDLKFRPIIVQTSTFSYHVISIYLKPLR